MVSVIQDMSYRDKPATPNSPSGTSVTTMYDHLLSPLSPGQEEEKDDRLRNDLLDEICNDMGIDDSMDLDFDDFCYSNQQAKPGASNAQQRFNQISTPSKSDSASNDVRWRNSMTTASSGYSTSDSLCAIAKLTQSISNDGPSSMSEGESKRSSPETCSGSVKQEPCELTENPNDTDQGKANKIAAVQRQQQQMADARGDMKRKRPQDQMATEVTERHSPMSEQALPTTSPSSQAQQQQVPPHWSYNSQSNHSAAPPSGYQFNNATQNQR